jgi:hypothetical protein
VATVGGSQFPPLPPPHAPALITPSGVTTPLSPNQVVHGGPGDTIYGAVGDTIFGGTHNAIVGGQG